MIFIDEIEIEIRQIIEDEVGITFIEFYSPDDSINHILGVDTFCGVFGYTLDDLVKISKDIK